MKIYDFQIEYQKNPIALTVKRPRFSWKIETNQPNTVQKSYMLLVKCGEQLVWDSGTVFSDQSVLIPYDGVNLEAETRYEVLLKVEDNYGNISQEAAWFETGILKAEDFQAKMITHDFPPTETACPVFYRKMSFSKKIQKARIYATAHGVYELYLNGQRIGKDCMAPGWTSYHHRLQYQCYDITEQIKEDNLLEIPVGNGWYKGILGFDCKPDRYGNKVEVFAEIHIWYEDGQKEVIATDENWHVRTGKIRYSEIYMGETIDTDQPEIVEGKVLEVPFDKELLTFQECEPVRITQRLLAKKLWKDPKGNLLVDFGQNITGLVEVKIKGEKGQKIRIRHAEVLDKDGVFYPDTLRTAISHDTYILNGEEQVLMPHFTFHGFRYIAIDGIEDPKPEMFTACPAWIGTVNIIMITTAAGIAIRSIQE